MRKRRDSWKKQVATNFNRAAGSYTVHSPVQKDSAEQLASIICERANPRTEHILELGCGTGHLTRTLYGAFGRANWLITDIAPQMVSACMKSMPQGPNLKYTVMDAEELNRDETFDLICSNLAAQWFTDTNRTLQKLVSHLTPGGLLALSTLGPNTLTRWREAVRSAGSAPLMPAYPDMDELRAAFPRNGHLDISSRTITARYDSAFDFARALKTIGAHSHPSPSQLNPGLVRSILRKFDDVHHGRPVEASYEIYFITFRNNGHD